MASVIHMSIPTREAADMESARRSLIYGICCVMEAQRQDQDDRPLSRDDRRTAQAIAETVEDFLLPGEPHAKTRMGELLAQILGGQLIRAVDYTLADYDDEHTHDLDFIRQVLEKAKGNFYLRQISVDAVTRLHGEMTGGAR